MKKKRILSNYPKFILSIFTTIFVSLFITTSCMSTKNLTNSSINKSEQSGLKFNNIVENTTLQIKDKEYSLAEETCIDGLREFIDNKKLLGLLGIAFYKQNKYEMSNKVLGRFFDLNENVYDSLSTATTNSNFYFDLFYYNISSLLEHGKVLEASEIINHKISFLTRKNLHIDNKVKLELLIIKINFILENYETVVTQVNKLLNKYTISNQSLKVNLYYLEAISYYKIMDYSTSVEVISKVVEIDTENLYSLKLFKSLEEVVYLANSEFLEIYSENIIKCYEALLTKAEKKSTRNKILRNIYDLKNSSISINSDDLILGDRVNKNKLEDGISVLSQISITTDKNNTKVQFSSMDSLKYDYEYDGTTLKIVFDNVDINSNKNSIIPKEGSGIKTFHWKQDKAKKQLSVELTFNDNYDMNFDELFDNFEKRGKYSVKYHLLLNISLPDEDLVSMESYSVKERLSEKGKKKKYTIIIDPGHGGDDPGAIGVKKKKDGKTRYTEKEVALLLSKELKIYLEKEGYRVFLTRTKDTYPTLLERNRIAESRNADMFLSIHLNSANRKNRKYWQTDRYYGSEMIVRKTLGSQPKIINSTSGNKIDSKNKWLRKRKKALKDHIRLSNIFSETIPNNLHKPFNKKRRIKYKNLAIFSGLTIPHALIETGFIINNRTLEYMLSTRGQNALFKGIAKGIKKYRGK